MNSLKVKLCLIAILSFSLSSIRLSAQSKKEIIQNLKAVIDSLKSESLRKEKVCHVNIQRQEMLIADYQRNLQLLLKKNNDYQDINDSIKRRLDADEQDFKDFNDYDLKVRDPEFTVEDVYDLMD